MLELCRCPNIYGPDCIYETSLLTWSGCMKSRQRSPCHLRSKHAETDGLEIQTFAEEMSQFCLEWFECHNNNNTLS